MKILNFSTQPFDEQKPGTSGLRKKVLIFEQPQYLENYIWSIFKANPRLKGGNLVVGGDGRYYNDKAIQKIIKLALAFGIRRVIVSKDGLLSTPAASYLIIKSKAEGGIVLSASHNPGGREHDFGVKFNMKNGGPAVEHITEGIYEESLKISSYEIADIPDVDISKEAEYKYDFSTVQVVDATVNYVDYMEKVFNLDKIKNYVNSKGLTIKYDGLNAITGIYAKELFLNRLGLSDKFLINCVPLEDFGGLHPDPNPIYAKELFDHMMSSEASDFGAASDGDGDRNMILGKGVSVSPSDSLAVLFANFKLINGVEPIGVARSMPTSHAVDRVADKLGYDCYITPTGWKFFGTLLDAKKINLCGEESYGTGSDHVREKDGLWAILAWLSIIAETDKSVKQILEEHWKTYGRDYMMRCDYENLSMEEGRKIYDNLVNKLEKLSGSDAYGYKIKKAYEYSYVDPIDNSKANNQGLVLELENDIRIVYRLSGTGTSGATLRVYIEKYFKDEITLEIESALRSYAEFAHKVAELTEISGKSKEDICVY